MLKLVALLGLIKLVCTYILVTSVSYLVSLVPMFGEGKNYACLNLLSLRNHEIIRGPLTLKLRFRANLSDFWPYNHFFLTKLHPSSRTTSFV